MKTSIVVAEIPTGEGQEQVERYKIWRELSDVLEKKAKTCQGTQTLGENVWLIDVETNLHFLCWLIGTLNANRMKTRISFIDEPLKWIDVKKIEP